MFYRTDDSFIDDASVIQQASSSDEAVAISLPAASF